MKKKFKYAITPEEFLNMTDKEQNEYLKEVDKILEKKKKDIEQYYKNYNRICFVKKAKRGYK